MKLDLFLATEGSDKLVSSHHLQPDEISLFGMVLHEMTRALLNMAVHSGYTPEESAIRLVVDQVVQSKFTIPEKAWTEEAQYYKETEHARANSDRDPGDEVADEDPRPQVGNRKRT